MVKQSDRKETRFTGFPFRNCLLAIRGRYNLQLVALQLLDEQLLSNGIVWRPLDLKLQWE